jgi:NAD(P)-dependent dehydrogenase (short-subunit alcohol dehydrogenase family)
LAGVVVELRAVVARLDATAACLTGALAERDARIVEGDARIAELEDTARLVRDEGVRCELVIGDVTEPGIAENAVAHTEATLGSVDLLVANAGVLGLGAVAEIDPSLWRRVIDLDHVADAVTEPSWRASRVTARGRA